MWYRRTLELYRKCNTVYPNHLGTWQSEANAAYRQRALQNDNAASTVNAALSQNAVCSLQSETAMPGGPSKDVTSSLQESRTSDAEAKAVNQRPKISESGLAVKWSALLH